MKYEKLARYMEKTARAWYKRYTAGMERLTTEDLNMLSAFGVDVYKTNADEIDRLTADLAAAKAEIERLREALSNLVRETDEVMTAIREPYEITVEKVEGHVTALTKARMALAGEAEK